MISLESNPNCASLNMETPEDSDRRSPDAHKCAVRSVTSASLELPHYTLSSMHLTRSACHPSCCSFNMKVCLEKTVTGFSSVKVEMALRPHVR